MQFNGKTIFLLKQMLVYLDIRNSRLNNSAGYRLTSLWNSVRILAMAKIIMFKDVYLCLSTHINSNHV